MRPASGVDGTAAGGCCGATAAADSANGAAGGMAAGVSGMDSAAAAAATAGAAPAAVSTSAMGAPIGTVSPSAARIFSSAPSTGEGTSIVTLSVTTSTSGSYRAMASPGCFSHLPIVPSTTDSPTWGSSIVCAKTAPPAVLMGFLYGQPFKGLIIRVVNNPGEPTLISRQPPQGGGDFFGIGQIGVL